MIVSMRKNGFILALFGIACAGLVALTFQGTKEQIAEQERRQLLKILDQIVPSDSYDNALYQACVRTNSAQYLGTRDDHRAFLAKQGDNPVAVALESTAPDGYNGSIDLIVGVDWDGKVLGVRTLKHQETPGLGDLIDLRRSDWVTGFNGYELLDEDDARWKVQRDGGDFDQFTGATITPRAYVKAVKNTLLFFSRYKDDLLAAPPCGDPS